LILFVDLILGEHCFSERPKRHSEPAGCRFYSFSLVPFLGMLW